MIEMTNFLKDFVKELVQNIVDKNDEVEIEVTTSTKNVIVQISVDDSDHGKVIGKKGNTIRALNILTTAVKNTQFSDDRRKVVIELLEDENNKFN